MRPETPLADIPGYVHGIVGIDPWMVQCDGCGLVVSGATASHAVQFSGIEFNPRLPDDHRRLCRDCRKAEPDWTWRYDL